MMWGKPPQRSFRWRERRRASDQYKADVVALARWSGRALGRSAAKLMITETAVGGRMQRADLDGGKSIGLTTSERSGLSRLGRQVRVLERGGHPLQTDPTR